MRKLIIQIPAYNEEGTIAEALRALPRRVPGFDSVEWLVIDDGSVDHTVEVALQAGADRVVSLSTNQGLARAFMAGIEASLRAGAEVIVNTDADNQYDASAIPELVRPILEGRAQIVVGARPISKIADFSIVKKLLQRLGSAAVRIASGTTIPDAPSGFRAIHREAALRLCVFNRFTYTLEMIIQAGRKNIPISWVPIQVNRVMRPSRLADSTAIYVLRSVLTILRIFILYKPLRFFLWLGTLMLVPGLLIGVQFLVSYLLGRGSGHVQSLILSAILVVTASISYVAGILADLVAANRSLLEDLRTRLLRTEIESSRPEAASGSGQTPRMARTG